MARAWIVHWAAIPDKLPALFSSDDILYNKKFKIASLLLGCIVREKVIKRKIRCKVLTLALSSLAEVG